MTYDEFRESCARREPTETLPPTLRALCIDLQGDWDLAHRIIQEVPSAEGSWIHAYLHRKEGDLGNAGYWYRKAGRSMPDSGLDEEWECIARELTGTP